MALFRLQPVGEPQDYKTFQVKAPKSTHYTKGTCADTGCVAYLFGWSSMIDENTPLGQQQAFYIRKQSERRFTETRGDELTMFDFEPGQECFQDHWVPNGRPELFIVKDGDWRASANARTHSGVDSWLDDFKTHQANLAEQIEKG